MMLQHQDAKMRTTIDIPERDHALFVSLARAQHTSLSKLLVNLAHRGLTQPDGVAEAALDYAIDPHTGLGLFRFGRPFTSDDVEAFQDEQDDAFAGR